jgi:hypothetical protein
MPVRDEADNFYKPGQGVIAFGKPDHGLNGRAVLVIYMHLRFGDYGDAMCWESSASGESP